MDSNSETLDLVTEFKGAFISSLVRNNKKIREDRALTINESTEMYYRRMLEDSAINIKQLKKERENMLDLSPTDAQSLVLASDFDAKSFVEKDMQLSVKLRNLEIAYEIGVARYNYLFNT